MRVYSRVFYTYIYNRPGLTSICHVLYVFSYVLFPIYQHWYTIFLSFNHLTLSFDRLFDPQDVFILLCFFPMCIQFFSITFGNIFFFSVLSPYFCVVHFSLIITTRTLSRLLLEGDSVMSIYNTGNSPNNSSSSFWQFLVRDWFENPFPFHLF